VDQDISKIMSASGSEVEAFPSDSFVNHGLIRWEKLRSEWQQKMEKTKAHEGKRPAAVDVDIDLVIERIFSPESTGELPHALPLPQVDKIIIVEL
jgi:hypothetical protein